jgi:hypothetical protein
MIEIQLQECILQEMMPHTHLSSQSDRPSTSISTTISSVKISEGFVAIMNFHHLLRISNGLKKH